MQALVLFCKIPYKPAIFGVPGPHENIVKCVLFRAQGPENILKRVLFRARGPENIAKRVVFCALGGEKQVKTCGLLQPVVIVLEIPKTREKI